MNYLILITVWAGYLGLHSLLAADRVKSFFETNLHISPQWYRLVYSILSGLGLLALFFLMAIMESTLLFPSGKIIKYLGMVLAVWGIILVVASFRKLSGKAFLGLKKSTETRLIRDGIHSKIRHPIYAGTILIFLGMFLYTPTDIVLVSVCVIYVYLPFGIYFEEQKLLKEFGDEYKQYKKDVPSLIPRFR